MAARQKSRSDTATNRESDKIIIRLPQGMRYQLATLAVKRGRSMTAEVVAALQHHISRDGDLNEMTILATLAEIRDDVARVRDAVIPKPKAR